ncbi:PRC-barrel domain-containing protein [Caldimonas brevitalea]|uniref:PRC-barrel domain-containing protein n=1 Tax=Caldimonas brevitalea TaxID=413882 RepID=A0A0G3BVQ4_9BURK|nr:PRC-barrel domain-containing protein [Caldimonas brevitalea]AKJ30610.1 hypothetical protein AAW51_3919 [Caldimonas brevitalea]
MSLRYLLLWMTAMAIALGSQRLSAQTAPAQQGTSSSQKEASPPGGGRTTYQAMRANDRWERTHRVSQIIGTQMHDKMGDKIGEVEDVVLGPDGALAYVIVSSGGVLGAGERMRAVPWQNVQVDGEGRLRVDIAKDRVENAPSFAPNNWPSLHDERWSQQNRQFYSSEAK